jgi:YbbR domain-containing protein
MLRHRVLTDKWLLLTCLVLGFFSWQGIRKNTGFQLEIKDVDVEINVPKNWAVWEKSVQRVNIVFRGSPEEIRYLSNEQLRVVIPVSDPKHDTEMVVRLSNAYLKNPTGAKVVSFSPSEITIKLDEESRRLLPVKAVHEGALPNGLDIEAIVCTPASVRVTGARKLLDEMDSVPTKPVSLANRQGSFKESVSVALPYPGKMRVDPDWVSVEFQLYAEDSTRTFQNIPVRTMCAPGEQRQIEIQPQAIHITVRGQQQRIEELKPEELFAYVGCHNLTESTEYDLPVTVDLPAGVQTVRTEPAAVHVQIGKIKQEF